MIGFDTNVLRRLYGFDRAGQAKVLSQALKAFTESSADFSDCLIAARNTRWGCESTATFDRSMGTLAGVALLKP